jgi:Concanavalin A-like lectin/glucanases superfamily/Bacterial Ig-like domain (group 2)
VKKLLLPFAIVILFVISFTSCAKKNEPVPDPLKSITLSKDTLKMNVGDTKSITVSLTPSTFDKTQLVWHSSDNTIITVNATGVITALREGDAYVTITNQAATITAICLVTVLPELKSLNLVKDTIKMTAGDTGIVSFTLLPVNYDKTALVWHSSDTTVLTVNNTGTITAKKMGDVILSLSNQSKTVSAVCLVSVLAKPIVPKVDSLKLGLIAYYPFNFDSAVDSSGNGNDGTIFNITSIPDRFGKANSAYHFNGTDSYIQVKDNQALRLSNTDFTLNTWVKLDSYNYSFGNNILTKHYTGVNNGWAWGITGQSYTVSGVVTFGPGGGSPFARGTSIININQWHMITSVYKLSTQQLSIYIDGVLDTLTANIPPPNGTIDAMLYIGKDDPSVPSNGYFVQGSLDDIRIYNRTLNTSEISKLYHLTH